MNERSDEPRTVYLLFDVHPDGRTRPIGAFSSQELAENHRGVNSHGLANMIVPMAIDATVFKPPPPHAIRRVPALEQMADSLREVVEKLEALRKEDRYP